MAFSLSSLIIMIPSLLEANYYKIAWGDRLGMATTRDGAIEMRELIHSIGNENVVISHVDSEEAVKLGLQLGVRRFQGFFVDKLGGGHDRQGC